MEYRRGDQFLGQTERRAAVRYKVSLELELASLNRFPLPELVHCTTRDASVRGFYFIDDQEREPGERLKFRILAPGRLKDRAAELVRGTAICVRIEEILGAHASQRGIAVRIEKTIRRMPRSVAFAPRR